MVRSGIILSIGSGVDELRSIPGPEIDDRVLFLDLKQVKRDIEWR